MNRRGGGGRGRLGGRVVPEDLRLLRTAVGSFLEEIVVQQLETQAYIRHHKLDMADPLNGLKVVNQMVVGRPPPPPPLPPAGDTKGSR